MKIGILKGTFYKLLITIEQISFNEKRIHFAFQEYKDIAEAFSGGGTLSVKSMTPVNLTNAAFETTDIIEMLFAKTMEDEFFKNETIIHSDFMGWHYPDKQFRILVTPQKLVEISKKAPFLIEIYHSDEMLSAETLEGDYIYFNSFKQIPDTPDNFLKDIIEQELKITIETKPSS
jgi:hypothetical protein